MNIGKQHNIKKTQGIALISVLFIAAVVLILASTFIFTIVRERQSATSSKLMNDSLQAADAVSERARMQILAKFDDSYFTPANFLIELKKGSSGTLNGLLQTFTEDVEGRSGKWKISNFTGNDASLSQSDAATYLSSPKTLKWIEVSATVTTASGVQTVIRRINMGEGELFRLAMLSRDTRCIYCHLRVNGDVGSLGDLRPGWGHEQDGTRPSGGWEEGWNSGNGSVVDGDVYIATKATKDAVENMENNDDKINPNVDKKINGAIFTGVVNEDYKDSPLPRDTTDPPDGEPDFPFIERERAIKNAKGSIALSTQYVAVVPLNSSPLSALPAKATTALSGVIDGNLILEGTLANPIKLSGDIYVTGDVIIKGYVEGRGAIYSGRNTYVAGNIQYKNPPAACAGDPDACAQAAIAAGKDELRLAARNNIVLGDYTEKTAGGLDKTWQGRQSADYYRAQFGFNDTNTNKYFSKVNGDELTLSGGVYKDVEGNVIPSGDVTPPINSQQAYEYSFQPGMVSSSGSFNNWMPDSLYQTVLGKEERKYDTWRYSLPDRADLTLTDLQKQFSGFGVTDAVLTSMLCPSGCAGQNVDLKNASGETIGQAVWSDKANTSDPDDFDLRVIIDSAYSYEKQVTKVDAFLYANQRIAGKTFNAPFSINGGMIAQEIGVLAPGIEMQWWMDERYRPILENRTSASEPRDEDRCKSTAFAAQFTTAADPTQSPAYNKDAEDCALTINYDYRLRNGGLGFNLVTPDAGQTMSWRLADSKTERVE